MATGTVYPRSKVDDGRTYDNRPILPGVRECPIADALDLVGDRWSMLVLREITMGAHRFSDIMRQTGIARGRLSQRLKALEAEGLIVREPYNDRPPRDEYRLTQAGTALTPVFKALAEWGSRYASG